jgi:hypothetical protein
LKAEQIAQAIGVGVVKLKPLLYALVAAGLLVMEDELKRCLSPRLGRVKLHGHP